MKYKYYLSILLIFTAFIVNAQEDYMEVIADRSCDCLAEKRAVKANLSTEEIGACLLMATKDYKDRIAKDHGLDLNTLNSETGEKLGELIGGKMAFTCPELIMGATDEEGEGYETFIATGKVLNISAETFVVFEIKNDSGKNEKFYWLTYVESDLDLQNMYQDLKGAQVEIEYLEQELFDSRLQEYRKFKMLTGLTKG